jgi:hypothetical protein
MNMRGFDRHEKKFPNLSTGLWTGRALEAAWSIRRTPVPRPSSDAIERALLGISIDNEPRRSTLSFAAWELRATTGGQLAPT